MKPPAFQFYADDFLGGTCDMSQGEIGAYILLLCYQWTHGFIPGEPERRQIVARGPVTEHVLAKFKQGEDGQLRNEKLESVRQEQAQYRESQRIKSALGVEARRKGKPGGQPTGQPTGGAGANPRSTSPPPSPSPEGREREEMPPMIPPLSRQEFDRLVEMRGVPKDCADWFWNTHDARDWRDTSGQPIRKVEPLLMNAVAKWRKKPADKAPPSPPTKDVDYRAYRKMLHDKAVAAGAKLPPFEECEIK